MDGLLYLSATLTVLLILVFWRFGHQLKRKRFLSSALWSMQSLILLLVISFFLLMFSNLLTYQRLTHESPVAEVYIRKLKPQQYQLSLSKSDKDEDQQYYSIKGDQWQLDAKVLKWKSWATLLGLDSHFQLVRLSGRYQDIRQASQSIPSHYDLSQPARGLDIWKMKQYLKEKAGFVDTYYGQGCFYAFD